MGKLEQQAKHVTVGILEVGGRFGFLEDGQTGWVVFGVVRGVIFSLVVLHATAKLVADFSSTAPVSCERLCNLKMQLVWKVAPRNERALRGPSLRCVIG
jgi:hypothetical protein